MKKTGYLLYLLSFFVFTINSQELDEDFLKSLPDDVRQDVLVRAEGQTEAKEKNIDLHNFQVSLSSRKN